MNISITNRCIDPVRVGQLPIGAYYSHSANNTDPTRMYRKLSHERYNNAIRLSNGEMVTTLPDDKDCFEFHISDMKVFYS